MPIIYADLRTELQTDPQTLGYAAPLAAGNHSALADLLNQIRPTIAIQRDTAPAWEVFECIVHTEWAALSAQEKQRIQTILSMGTVSIKGPNTRSAFLASFGAGTATRTALAAMQNRQGSRAEQLFGQSVTVADVAQALGGQ